VLVLGRSLFLWSTLFALVALPGVPVSNFVDYYMAPHSHDLVEEMRPDAPLDYYHWRRTANAFDLLEIEHATAVCTHTAWQRDLFPPEYRSDMQVMHDGIDIQAFRGAGHKQVGRSSERIVGGRTVPPDTMVVSYVAR